MDNIRLAFAFGMGGVLGAAVPRLLGLVLVLAGLFLANRKSQGAIRLLGIVLALCGAAIVGFFDPVGLFQQLNLLSSN